MARESKIVRRPDGTALKSIKYITGLIGLTYAPYLLSQVIRGNVAGIFENIGSLFVSIVILVCCIDYHNKQGLGRISIIIPVIVLIISLIAT